MSNTILISKNVVARKDYFSNYAENFDNLIKRDENGKKTLDINSMQGYERSEIDLIQSCIDDNWLIKKGELHYYQTGVYDGDMYTARAKIGIHEICIKHELFYEY